MKTRVKIAICLYIIAGVFLAIAIVLKIQMITPEQEYKKHVKFFEEIYGIIISSDDCPDEAKMEYTLEFSTNLDKINRNLDTIAKCMENIPTGLLEQMNAAAYITIIEGKYMYTPDATKAIEGFQDPVYLETDLHLILCESVKNGKTVIGGYTACGECDNYIILALGSEHSAKDTFFHEFFHVLEWKSGYMLEVGKFSAFSGWSDHNPEEFKYSTDASQYVLGITENKEDVYFVSEYATKSSKEDMAELFAYLMCLEDKAEFDELMQYPNLKEKIKFLDVPNVFILLKKKLKLLITI